MPRRPLLAAIASLALCLPTSSPGQYYGNPNSVSSLPVHTIGPNRGGVIGLSVDTRLYTCGEATCVKVTALNGTNFYGIRVGDYIFKVNNIFFHNVDAFFGLIRENPPGSIVRIDYWEAANGLRSMNQSAALTGAQNASYSSMVSLLPELETIMRTDASHWEVSTYRAGSLRDLSIASVASDQRSYVIRGIYNYRGVWSSNYQDWVDFHFSGRDLSCIEYGHERGCRPLLAQDRSRLATALAVAGVVAVAVVASRSRGSSGSSSGGGYRGETRYQCEARCNRYPGDSNPAVEASVIAQCRRGCASLPSY